MLKRIDPLLNADLLYVLAAMGHGDELAVVDNNFPATSHAQRLVRVEGVDTTAAGRAILSVFPLDTFVDEPLVRMEVVGAPDEVTFVQADFHRLAEAAEGRAVSMGSLPRHAFYDRARAAFAVVSTSETRPYGCFLLVKGVIGAAAPGTNEEVGSWQ
jgi:L-fucose mutarotase